MKMKILLGGLAAVALTISGAASAANNGKSNGKDKNAAAHGRNAQRDYSGQRYVMQKVSATRKAERTASSCPHGLAKKNNGCLAPGQAKKRTDPASQQITDLIKLPSF